MAKQALNHILVRNKELASDLYNELISGASFATLAREYSICPSGSEGGFAGYHEMSQLPQTLRAALKSSAMEPYSPPVQTHLGYHLIQRVSQARQAEDFSSTSIS